VKDETAGREEMTGSRSAETTGGAGEWGCRFCWKRRAPERRQNWGHRSSLRPTYLPGTIASTEQTYPGSVWHQKAGPGSMPGPACFSPQNGTARMWRVSLRQSRLERGDQMSWRPSPPSTGRSPRRRNSRIAASQTPNARENVVPRIDSEWRQNKSLLA